MGFKDISDNLLNKGEHTKEQVKSSELSIDGSRICRDHHQT